MAMSESQKKAIQEYRKRRGGVQGLQKSITATVSPAEAERIKSAFKSVEMSNADILKRAADRISQGDDLRRDYDATSNSLVSPGGNNYDA